jgi:hypothetical protein
MTGSAQAGTHFSQDGPQISSAPLFLKKTKSSLSKHGAPSHDAISKSLSVGSLPFSVRTFFRKLFRRFYCTQTNIFPLNMLFFEPVPVQR